MARFELVETTILDPDGVSRQYQVIKDRSTFEAVYTHFGNVVCGNGFIRCRGKYFIGSFGSTAVMGGEADGVYYAPVSYFDGDWRHRGANSRGLYDHVTAQSGSGKLFAALENFCEANGVQARP